MHASKWTERTKRKRDVQAAGPRTHGEEECYKRQNNGRTQQLVLSNSHFSLEERGEGRGSEHGTGERQLEEREKV